MGAQASMADAAGYYSVRRSLHKHKDNNISDTLQLIKQQEEITGIEPTNTVIFGSLERSGNQDKMQTSIKPSEDNHGNEAKLIVDEEEIRRQNLAAQKPYFTLHEGPSLDMSQIDIPQDEQCHNSITPSIMETSTDHLCKSIETVDFTGFKQIPADKNVGRIEIVSGAGFRFKRKTIPQGQPTEEQKKRIERFRQSVRQRYVI